MRIYVYKWLGAMQILVEGLQPSSNDLRSHQNTRVCLKPLYFLFISNKYAYQEYRYFTVSPGHYLYAVIDYHSIAKPKYYFYLFIFILMQGHTD